MLLCSLQSRHVHSADVAMTTAVLILRCGIDDPSAAHNGYTLCTAACRFGFSKAGASSSSPLWGSMKVMEVHVVNVLHAVLKQACPSAYFHWNLSTCRRGWLHNCLCFINSSACVLRHSGMMDLICCNGLSSAS